MAGEKLYRVDPILKHLPIDKLRSKKISTLVTAQAQRADSLGKTLRVFFQDEGRFGRISDPRACWVPKPFRAQVKAQHIREYTYVFAAIAPQDGALSSFVVDQVNAETMSLFLAEVTKEYPDEEILMVMDGASWHRAKELRVPPNIMPIYLPPYSPELNPVEHFWDYLRETYFPNRCFDSLDAVISTLVHALRHESHNDKQLKSMTDFPWIGEASFENWH